MKTRLLTPDAVWLLVCSLTALLILSACRGPAPITGSVNGTATPAVRPETPTPSATNTPAPTETATPAPETTATPTSTGTPETPPPPADTSVPDDTKPARPTETPVANIKPAEISGYSLKQGSDGGWIYVDKNGKEVAHTVLTQVSEQIVSPNKKPERFETRRAIVVTDEILMRRLIQEGNPKSDVAAGRVRVPLPFDPKDFRLGLMQYGGYQFITIDKTGTSRPLTIYQPFPENVRAGVNLYQSGNENEAVTIAIYAPRAITPATNEWKGKLALLVHIHNGKIISGPNEQSLPFGSALVSNVEGSFSYTSTTATLNVTGGALRSTGFRDILTYNGYIVGTSSK